ncbi:MAG: tetratricopeptide repeat protein [Gemmatimonadetes bacterium]|nr:tetratricopeptide repeat protein [Gemmatimonadota bacterium]
MRREAAARGFHSGLAAALARRVRFLAAPGGTALTCLLVSFLAAGALASQEGRVEIEEGNRLYEEQRYEEARARYLEALRKAPELALAHFNEGAALYKQGDFESSAEAYMEALGRSDPEWRSQAWYNLGNAMLEQQQAEGAIDAYKEALRLNPADQDAKHNLEYALRLLQQQQQQEQDQEEQDGEEEDEEEQSGEDRQDQQGQGEQDQSEDGEEQSDREASAPEGGDEGEDETPPADGEVSEMTPEQAARLLQAVTEDPGEVNRKAAQPAGRNPRKEW